MLQVTVPCLDTTYLWNRISLSGTDKIAAYRDSFIIAGDFSKTTNVMGFDLQLPQLTAVYNSIPLHSRPLAINTITNTLLRQLQAEEQEKSSIGVSTHPLPQPKTVRHWAEFDNS